jgi:hypothetical protein
MARAGEFITASGGMMGHPILPALFAGAAIGVAAMPAAAVSCYEVIDRSNMVIYRDTTTPVDLSDAGKRAREAMRVRGELLVFFDTDTCVTLGQTTVAGKPTLTVDEIVGGYKGFAGRNAWSSYKSTWTGSTAGNVK